MNGAMHFYRIVEPEPYRPTDLTKTGYTTVDETVVKFLKENRENLMQITLPTFDQYQELTQRTVSRPAGHDSSTDIVHGCLGACSEVGELHDAVKRFMFYGKPLDVVNMKEEVGDVLWYLALIAEGCGFTLQGAAEANIRKLTVRYSDKFSEFSADNRNLEAERAALQG